MQTTPISSESASPELRLYEHAVELLQGLQYPGEKSPSSVTDIKADLLAITKNPLFPRICRMGDAAGDKLLHTAISCKAFDFAGHVAKQPGTLEERNALGLTPLLQSVHQGQLQFAYFLVKCGANIHATRYVEEEGSHPHPLGVLHLLAKQKFTDDDKTAYAKSHIHPDEVIASTKTAHKMAENKLLLRLADVLLEAGANPELTTRWPNADSPLKTPAEIARDVGNITLASKIDPTIKTVPVPPSQKRFEWCEAFYAACRENRLDETPKGSSVATLLAQGRSGGWLNREVFEEAIAIAVNGNRREDGSTTDGRNAHSYHKLEALLNDFQKEMYRAGAQGRRNI